MHPLAPFGCPKPVPTLRQDETVAAIAPRQQRAELAVRGLSIPQHDLLPGAAFGLGPAFRSAGPIGSTDCFETMPSSDSRQAECRTASPPVSKCSTKRIDLAFSVPPRLQQFFQPRLSLAERQAAEVFAAGEQQIEHVEDQLVGLAVGDRGLQRGKIRRAIMIERDDLAVDQRIGQCAAFFRNDILGQGRRQDAESVGRSMAEAREGLSVQLEAFAANTMEYLKQERDLLLDGVGVPDVATRDRPGGTC